MRRIWRISALLEGQRPNSLAWCAVLMGLGIGLYFALPVEPGRILWGALGLSMAAAIPLAARGALLPAALLALGAGAALAGLRTAQVEAPVLSFRYYGPIEGRIVAVDRSQSDAVRLTLDRVVLTGVDPEGLPERVRVSLHGTQGALKPAPGQSVMLTGHLSPPSGPVEPGGYDFARQAYFQRLGAVGYTRTPVMLWAPAGDSGWRVGITRLRMAISGEVQARIPGRAGAFAAAVMTGDRSGMDAETVEALRLSNLSHLLAISGLHMGLLTGFVFAALRLGIAAIPMLALRLPGKKIAAALALPVAAAYLALSGGSIATERAFIMVAVMLCAVLADRRAITLRSVALAAIIVLALRPEALGGPGFQMSFAATTALIAAFAGVRDSGYRAGPRWIRPVIALVLSSLVAGLATAPIAAAHFNRLPHYGLAANLAAVPVMGTFVMPGAVLAAVLTPLGAEGIGLWLMRWPIEWILAVADTVAGWPGAVSHVVKPPTAVLPMLTLGALWLLLWQGRGRGLGLPVMLAALLVWGLAERPAVLVADTGGLVGVVGPEGRALSKPRGDGFAGQSWLENDGDGADQAMAAARTGFRDGPLGREARLGAFLLVHVTGRGAAERARAACGTADIVVTSVAVASPPGGCALYDAMRLRKTGALSIEVGPPLQVRTAAEAAGRRPWTAGDAQ